MLLGIFQNLHWSKWLYLNFCIIFVCCRCCRWSLSSSISSSCRFQIKINVHSVHLVPFWPFYIYVYIFFFCVVDCFSHFAWTHFLAWFEFAPWTAWPTWLSSCLGRLHFYPPAAGRFIILADEINWKTFEIRLGSSGTYNFLQNWILNSATGTTEAISLTYI